MNTRHKPAAPIHEVIAGTVITSQTPVLLHRPVNPGTDLSATTVFGDAKWSLAAAVPDRHTADQSLNWARYPQSLRHSCKLYAFALLNVIDDAPRLANSRTSVPGVKTLVADLGYLFPFTRWLHERGIGGFNDVAVIDLDAYYNHVNDKEGVSPNWKRKAFLAVQRLHAYRAFLPVQHRLPAAPLWGGASAAELAESPIARATENATLRIHPDVMEVLLSAALTVVETIAEDLLPVARRLVAMRTLAHTVAQHELRPHTQGADRNQFNLAYLQRLLPALAAAGHSLPGRIDDGQIVLDHVGLAMAGWFERAFLRAGVAARATIAASGLRIRPGLLTVTRFSSINDRPWRTDAVDAQTLAEILRHVTTACFLAITYLSGVRTGEALNLRSGCISRDATLDMVFLSGQQMKATPDRRERSPDTIPWVVTDQVARAVCVLDAIAPGSMLFPSGQIASLDWITEGTTTSRRGGVLNRDISALIDWFNTAIAPQIQHPVIGADPGGTIVPSRLRRTLAWHIVRRPGGTVAGATQYGHLHTRITQGYAGRADAGFLDDITFEQFLLRAETLHEDYQRLHRGEHVSGPAAEVYRARVAASERFAGVTITTAAQATTALANPDLQVHHGALLTCVYRPATAACHAESDSDGPVWSRCRLTCSNAARTDRDVAVLRDHVNGLKDDLAMTGMPIPLRDRIRDRLAEHQRALAVHDASRADTAGHEVVGNL